jgi:hypothetical protein
LTHARAQFNAILIRAGDVEDASPKNAYDEVLLDRVILFLMRISMVTGTKRRTIVLGSGTAVTSNIGVCVVKKLDAGGNGSTVVRNVFAPKALPRVADGDVVITGFVGICQSRGLPLAPARNGADRTK